MVGLVFGGNLSLESDRDEHQFFFRHEIRVWLLKVVLLLRLLLVRIGELAPVPEEEVLDADGTYGG